MPTRQSRALMIHSSARPLKIMKKITKIISIVLLLLALGCVGYGIYWLGLKLIGVVIALKPEVVAAIIGAMATVSGGLAAVIISSKQSKNREIDESHRAKKVEIYKGFLDAVSGIMANSNENVTKKGFTDQELIDYLVEFKTDILLWGSPKVIKYQLEFQLLSSNPDKTSDIVNNLYKAIREDIGLSNKGLDNYELVKMYLSNPSELDEVLASNGN